MIIIKHTPKLRQAWPFETHYIPDVMRIAIRSIGIVTAIWASIFSFVYEALLNHQWMPSTGIKRGPPQNYVRSLLRDHKSCGISVGRYHGRHDRGVDHAKPIETMYPQ